MKQKVTTIFYGCIKKIEKSEALEDGQTRITKQMNCLGIRLYETSFIRPRTLKDEVVDAWGSSENQKIQ